MAWLSDLGEDVCQHSGLQCSILSLSCTIQNYFSSMWCVLKCKAIAPPSVCTGSFSSANAEALQDHDVPCAVCTSGSHRTVLMIPARTECYDGWREQYRGYLVAASYSDKGRTEFVCMDQEPEADADGYRADGGVRFYQAEGRCGSLPCPPYSEGKEFSCVVCTK